MFAAGKTSGASAGGGTPDPQFNYVTMLLHGDGTNGAQNNTFIDSSSTGATVTRTGNTTQGSFTPFGSNWSNYFVSSASSYLNFGNQTALHLGSGSYTVEMWLWKNDNAQYMTACGDLLAVLTNTWQIIGDAGGTKICWYNGASNSFTLTSNATIPLNTWTHIAFVRSSTTLTLYINGVSDSSTTLSTDYNASTSFFVGHTPELLAGRYWNGYISNFRMVKGTAVYTSNFTPSTTPLTAITNTSLLTCQSNRFIDNSTNNFTATVNGSPSVQRFNPFGTATAYSTSVIGGAGFFDGSSQLSFSTNAGQFGTGDFTFECWVYRSSASGQIFIADFGASSASGWGLYDEGSGGNMQFRIGDVDRIAVNPLTAGAWSHVAVVRSGTTATLYVNGTSAGSYGSASTNLTYSGTNYIGSQNGSSSYINGYMSNARAVKGTAVYTSAFTPSTTPLTAISGTSLLLSFTNGAIFDNAMMNDLETVGNAQISTSVVKYGTGSMYFDGTGDGLFARSTPDSAFGTGDFTVEFWINLAANLGSFVKIIQLGTTGNAFTIETQSTTNLLAVTNFTSTVYFFSSTALTTSTWVHVAATRASGTLRLFQNGTQVGSASNTVDFQNAGGIYIGQSSTSQAMNGYLDDLRITKGYARYTANFTPPTAAFPNTGPI